jgi:GNAT superfamily N-acetyltransferase
MNKDALTIRPGTMTDAALIAEFNYKLAIESENKRLDRIVLQAGVDKALTRSDLCRYFVAEFDKRVIGQTMVTFEWSDWRAAMFWWMQSVYVHPDFRGRGVFKALYMHIETQARKNPEVCGLRLYVNHHNHRATDTYLRLGMKHSGYHLYEVDWSNPPGDVPEPEAAV